MVDTISSATKSAVVAGRYLSIYMCFVSKVNITRILATLKHEYSRNSADTRSFFRRK